MNNNNKKKPWQRMSYEQKNNIDLGGFVATNMQTSAGEVWLSLRGGCQEKEMEPGGAFLICSFGREQQTGGPCVRF